MADVARGLVIVPGGDSNIRTGAGKRDRGSRANTVGSTGDKANLAFEFHLSYLELVGPPAKAASKSALRTEGHQYLSIC